MREGGVCRSVVVAVAARGGESCYAPKLLRFTCAIHKNNRTWWIVPHKNLTCNVAKNIALFYPHWRTDPSYVAAGGLRRGCCPCQKNAPRRLEAFLVMNAQVGGHGRLRVGGTVSGCR